MVDVSRPREVEDYEVITQFGSRRGGFRSRPRPTEPDVSVLLGRVAVGDAARLVRGRLLVGDGVRFASVGALRLAGFNVSHTPSRRIPMHASIERVRVWDDRAGRRFDSTYSEPQFHE